MKQGWLTNTYKTWRENENSYKIVSGPKAVLEFLVPISNSFEWFSIAYKTALEKRSWAETFTDTEEKTGRRFNFNEPESGVRGRQAETCLPHRFIDFLFWYLKDIILYKSYLILDHLTINNSPTEENSTKNKNWYLHSFWVEVVTSLAWRINFTDGLTAVWGDDMWSAVFFYCDEINNKQILTAK